MSLLLALAFFGAAAQPVHDVMQETENPEIKVIGRRLNDWRGNWKLRGSKVTCETTRSTGDKEIDAIGCAAMVTCLSPFAAEFQAIEDSKEDRRLLEKRLLDIMNRALPCMTAERKAGIAALADRRAGQ